MITIANASWKIESATVFLNYSSALAYWSFHIYGGNSIDIDDNLNDPDDDLNDPPFFYSDYFAPLSRGKIRPFEDFGGLFIPNGDEFDLNDGSVVFGCYLGTHENTQKNRLIFGAVDCDTVNLHWEGFTPLYQGNYEGLFPFSSECLLRYTGMRVKNTSENDARSFLGSIDPNREYDLVSVSTNAFNLVPRGQQRR